MKIVQRLREQLDSLSAKGGLRSLRLREGLIDFCSNDYLGLARSAILRMIVQAKYKNYSQSGATGSRLLSGQYALMEELETLLCQFHQSPAALLFNSGYDANLSLLGSLSRRGDVVLYDALVHASIHDGMRMGKADCFAFGHNDCQALTDLLTSHSHSNGQVFVVVESLYSMDGDLAPLLEIATLCEQFGAALIVDEAHATGVIGKGGVGLVQHLGLEEKIFARVHTFGKAIGGHGAVILGSKQLRSYLVNFARPLIFSTALPLHSVLHALEAYKMLALEGEEMRTELEQKILYYRNAFKPIGEKLEMLPSNSPIQGIIIPGNEVVSSVSLMLEKEGFDVRPIRYPTVPKGTERLRICLHRFNTEEEIDRLADCLQAFYP